MPIMMTRHLDPDREAVIASLREHGIGAVVNVGANRAGTEHSLELAQKYDFFYGAAGVHPSDTMEFENGTVSISWLREIASQPKMLAIGEIGLDYYWVRLIVRFRRSGFWSSWRWRRSWISR